MGDDEAIRKLTAAMSAGEAEAVDTFYRRYFDWLYAQARHVSRRDESFCLDIVQDAVLRIIRNVRMVQSEAQLLAWMRLVVRSSAYDLLRGERRRGNRELALADRQSSDLPREFFPDERIDWLKRNLAKFDPQLVRMIELRFERQWKLARIGKLLGLSIGTIDGRLRRAIKELRHRATLEFDDE